MIPKACNEPFDLNIWWTLSILRDTFFVGRNFLGAKYPEYPKGHHGGIYDDVEYGVVYRCFS
jgi:hypothetical protein